MLLSLVENAIKHGVEPKPGPGRICLQAEATGTQLLVRVIDDGVGLKDGLSSGIGLANVREQLDVRYGSEAWLKVAAPREGGTGAEIMVPLRTPTA
jgi:sensor histidine kinase YesM